MSSDHPLAEAPDGSFLHLRERLESALLREGLRGYGDRLLSLAGYGSVARGKFHAESDFDFILAIDPWDGDNGTRWKEFEPIERAMEPEIAACRAGGWQVRLSPVFKSREDVEYGSPLFIDMVDEGRILFDRDDTLRQRLELMRSRMRKLGSKRIWDGDTWYWDLKPDWKRGDVIEL